MNIVTGVLEYFERNLLMPMETNILATDPSIAGLLTPGHHTGDKIYCLMLIISRVYFVRGQYYLTLHGPLLKPLEVDLTDIIPKKLQSFLDSTYTQ